MNNEISLTITIALKASPEKVWHALTDPEEIRKYFFGTETKTDWVPGHPIIFSGEWEGKHYEDKGVVREFVPNKVLKYSYWSAFSGIEDKPENYQVVSFALTFSGGITTLVLTQENIPTEESKQHSEVNWKSIMEVFKKQVEE